MEDVTYQSPIIEGRRRKSSKKTLIIFLVLLLLVPLLIAGVTLFAGQQQEEAVPTPTPTSVVFPTDTPAPSATPTAAVTPTVAPNKSSIDAKTKLDRATLSVMVQNGSGVVGAANKAAGILKQAGYVISGTQNADNYDYQDVTISVKAGKAAFAPLLKQDLSSEYTVTATNTTLNASTSADAVVIIGK